MIKCLLGIYIVYSFYFYFYFDVNRKLFIFLISTNNSFIAKIGSLP